MFSLVTVAGLSVPKKLKNWKYEYHHFYRVLDLPSYACQNRLKSSRDQVALSQVWLRSGNLPGKYFILWLSRKFLGKPISVRASYLYLWLEHIIIMGIGKYARFTFSNVVVVLPSNNLINWSQTCQTEQMPNTRARSHLADNLIKLKFMIPLRGIFEPLWVPPPLLYWCTVHC